MTTPRNALNTALLTVLHLLVDGMCACSVLMLQPELMGMSLALLFVGYNVLAFMTQPFVGMWMDRRRPGAKSLWAAVLLLFSGALLTTIFPLCHTQCTELTLLTAVAATLGMGNSIFHVWGGKYVTDSTSNDPRHLGIFVSSGALGLTLGGLFHSITLMIILAVMMLIVVATLCKITAVTDSETATNCQTIEITTPSSKSSDSAAQDVAMIPDLLLFMLIIVFARSFVGNMKAGSTHDIIYFAAIASVLAFVGKASGGFIARRFGVWATLTAALLISGVCLLMSGWHWTFAILLVLGINLTMPLTLHLANRSMPQHAGFAFGALAFMLIPGHALALSLAGNAVAFRLLCVLVATIVIEALVLLTLRERRWKVLAMSVVMNVLTNLPLNLAVRFVPALQHPSLPMQIVLEVAVVIIETALFYVVTHNRRTALLYAVLCNATSYLCGLLFGLIYSLLT